MKLTSSYLKKYKKKIIVSLILLYLIFFISEILGVDKYIRPLIPKSEQEMSLLNITKEYLKEEYMPSFYDIVTSKTKDNKPKEIVTLFWEKDRYYFLMIGTYSPEKNMIGWTLEILTHDIIISDKSDIKKINVFFKKDANTIDYNCEYMKNEEVYSCRYNENKADGTMTHYINNFDSSFNSIERATKTPLINIKTEILYCYIKKEYDGGGCLFN